MYNNKKGVRKYLTLSQAFLYEVSDFTENFSCINIDKFALHHCKQQLTV